jgi:stage II sporulation protein D
LRKVILTAVIVTLLFFFIPMLLPGPDSAAPKGAVPETTTNNLSGGKKLRVLLDGEIHEMDTNEYIWGVVAAEMPASFELEALKAQAVAARTYAVQKSQLGKANHPDADVCGDSTCCQAYISPEKAAKNWGANAEAYNKKITQAVAETGSQVIVYDGQLITAVFHSSSSQETLDSVEVWGGNLPYLVGVKSPEGDEVPNYHTEVTVAGEEFRKTFLAAHPDAVLGGAPSQWFGEAVRTSGGSVNQITIGGVVVKGTEVRSLYKLRSACFTVEPKENQVIFRVTGNGHGVGMSQYGANTMAKQGKSYQDILTWYYTGVKVENCPENMWKS